MFPYGAYSFGGNDDDELDGEYGEFGDEYQRIFLGDKNVSFGGDMDFENLESFDETKKIGEPAGPEGMQRQVRRLFGLRRSSKPDSEALDDDTRKEVQKMLKCPRWNGDYKQWLPFELLWRRFHDHWSRRCGADLMAKILITKLPEAKRALYTELHMTMGWTYQQIILVFGGAGTGPTKPAVVLAGMDSLAASAWKIVGEVWNIGAEMESFAPKGHAGCSR